MCRAYTAKPLLQSRKADFSCRSSCAVVIDFFHGGRRGTLSFCLFSIWRLTVLFSSWSSKRYGLLCVPGACCIILTLRRSDDKSQALSHFSLDNQSANIPAVNSTPASSAVFKNSSRSRSCVTDLSFEVGSKSVVYYFMSALSCIHTRSPISNPPVQIPLACGHPSLACW